MSDSAVCFDLHVERRDWLDLWEEEDHGDEEGPCDCDKVDGLGISAKTERALPNLDFVFVPDPEYDDSDV